MNTMGVLTEIEPRNFMRLVRIPRRARVIEYRHIPGEGHSIAICFNAGCEMRRIETPARTVLALSQSGANLHLLLDREEDSPEWFDITDVEIIDSVKA